MINGITFASYVAPTNITKKEELENGDMVTLRNGDVLVYSKAADTFVDISETCDNCLSDLDDLNENLTFYDRDDKDYDIMTVDRPVRYETVFKRDETVREMTLEEICKELGYDVKIVKEEE